MRMSLKACIWYTYIYQFGKPMYCNLITIDTKMLKYNRINSLNNNGQTQTCRQLFKATSFFDVVASLLFVHKSFRLYTALKNTNNE